MYRDVLVSVLAYMANLRFLKLWGPDYMMSTKLAFVYPNSPHRDNQETATAG